MDHSDSSIIRKMLTFAKKKKISLRLLVIGLISFALVIAAVTWFATSRFNAVPQIVSSVVIPKHSEQFPEIDITMLDDRQQRIIMLLKQEHRQQNSAKKYSEGIDEPWCADFVSWIMKEAGVPLSNPNSGSWRIPGTHTLRNYYQSIGKFKLATSGYQPKIGDVILYDNPSPFGQHTNIVIKNDNGVLTTVGGNEPGGIRVYTHTDADKNGIVGYGTL